MPQKRPPRPIRGVPAADLRQTLASCEGGLDGGFGVFGEASGSVDPSERPFDHPALGQDDEPLICLSVRLTTVTEMRLASKAARCASSPLKNGRWAHGA